MNKRFLLVAISFIFILTGCSNNTTTMVFKKDKYTVEISTDMKAIVVPENCNMRSEDGFIVKVVDGETARGIITEQDTKGNCEKSLNDNGEAIYTLTITEADEDTETSKEEISLVKGITEVDLAIVTTAIGNSSNPINIQKLLEFNNSLKVKTKGSYTPYSWDVFLQQTNEYNPERDHDNIMHSYIDEAIDSNPDLAKQALSKDNIDTQEDYDKIIDYERELEDDVNSFDAEQPQDFYFYTNDSYNNVFILANPEGYKQNLDGDNKPYYISKDEKFSIKPLVINADKSKSAEQEFNSFVDNNEIPFDKYVAQDGAYVALNSDNLDAFIFWDLGKYTARVHIVKQPGVEATQDELLNVLSYIITIKNNNLYIPDSALAEELGMGLTYNTTKSDIIPIELANYTGTSESVSNNNIELEITEE